MSVRIEEPVSMCHTFTNNYWAHGHIPKAKFRGRLLSYASEFRLEGDEDVRDILAGRVKHGWIISVAGDWSGCGGDYTIYFLENEPPDVGAVWEEPDPDLYEEDDEVPTGEIIDKQLCTWWEPGS